MAPGPRLALLWTTYETRSFARGRGGRMRRWLATVLTLTAAATAVAQEGFPLDGTWRGEREGGGPNATIVIVMQWDGQKVTGLINPGPKSIPIAEAKLIPQ